MRVIASQTPINELSGSYQITNAADRGLHHLWITKNLCQFCNVVYAQRPYDQSVSFTDSRHRSQRPSVAIERSVVGWVGACSAGTRMACYAAVPWTRVLWLLRTVYVDDDVLFEEIKL